MNDNIRSATPNRNAGFTLVELMVVVLIVAILAAVAYPGYRNQVVKTHRGAAKACLAQYVQLLERYYTTELTYDYVTNTADVNPVPPGCTAEDTMPANYAFSVDQLTATTFRVIATPTTAFDARDRQCGALRLDQAGVKSVSSGTLADCW